MRRVLAEKVRRPVRSAGRVRQVFPRYVAVGNSRKVSTTKELLPGRVYADFDADGDLIGVEIL